MQPTGRVRHWKLPIVATVAPFWSDWKPDRQQQRPATSPTLMAIELSTADWNCSFVGNASLQQQVHPNRKLKT